MGMVSMKKNLLVMGVIILILVVGYCSCANAQTVICNMTIAGLMACKPSITPPNPTKPTTACCLALSHADMNCLCSYKNSKLLPSLGIDPKLAMQLPAKCKLPRPANC